MIQEGQLAQSVGSAQSQAVPAILLPTGANTNLLGNADIQIIHSSSPEGENFPEGFWIFFSAHRPHSRLAVIKKETFTHEGRAERVRQSLAALNAPQPTELPIAQWKAILEEIEDED